MSKRSVEQELRALFLGLSGLAFIGATVELWLVEHYESFIQTIPFFLCSIGLIMIFIFLKKPGIKTVYGLRYTSIVIALGGLFGMYEHLRNNLAFEMEVHPEYTFGTAFWEALGGATPLMAPGILFFAALLAMASTWRHPVLSENA